MTNRHPLAFVTLTVIGLAACGASSPPPNVTELRSDKLRVTDPAVTSDDAAALAAGNLQFAVDMHAKVRARNDGKNFIFSQTSMSTALAMLYAGAANQTAAQMATALHFTLPPERLHPAFDALDLALTAPAGNDAGAFRLKIANSTWVTPGFIPLPSYLDVLAESYGAGLYVQDFASAPEPGRKAVNAWVSHETEAQIPELFPKGSIDASTVLVLANAVFFHGDWATRFDSPSPNGTFHAPAGDVSVPMMYARHNGDIAFGSGFASARLRYIGDTTSMVVVVPDAGTFDTFEAGLTADRLMEVLAQSGTTGDVALPRFKFATATDLVEPLKALGMTDAFTAAADLSGIAGGLFVQAVVHQATIAVDEKGTTAAAATGISVGTTSVSTSLVVDRAFLFFVVHEPTGAILFQGRVLDPR